MINLTVDEIIQIHERLIQKTGGMPGLRNFKIGQYADLCGQIEKVAEENERIFSTG